MIMRKRGVALIWALVLSSVLLIISGTMVSYIIKESQFSVRVTDSTQAYAHAKSGVEWAKHCVANNPDIITTSDNETTVACGSKSFDLDGNGDDDTTVTVTTTLDDSDWLVTSEGTISDVTRRLEYSIVSSTPTLIDFSSIGDIPLTAPLLKTNNSESFEMSFIFWQKDGTTNPSFRIGADTTPQFSDDNDENLPYIAGGIDSFSTENEIFLNMRQADGLYKKSTDSASWTPETSENKATPYKYRATLKYLKNTAASLKIERLDIVSGTQSPACVSYLTLDLTNIDFGNLDYLHLLDAEDSYIYISSGDYASDYIEGTLSNGIYIDNITFDN